MTIEDAEEQLKQAAKKAMAAGLDYEDAVEAIAGIYSESEGDEEEEDEEEDDEEEEEDY